MGQVQNDAEGMFIYIWMILSFWDDFCNLFKQSLLRNSESWHFYFSYIMQ